MNSNRPMISIAIFLSIVTSIACSHHPMLAPSSDSSYQRVSQGETLATSPRRALAAAEVGITQASGHLSSLDRQRLEDRVRLRQLEHSIPTQHERQLYSQNISWFQSDRERIDFLSQPDFASKAQWLRNNGIGERANRPGDQEQFLIESEDITLNMPESFVRQAWGDPREVLVAGNPDLRNEKWVYEVYVSTPEGFRKQTREVYFEGGRVVGWSSQLH